MKRTFRTLLVLCCLALCLTFCLTACSDKCEHSYDNACDAICNECEEIREVGSHDWSAATCTASKTCKICGLTEGEALGHEWTTPDVDICEVQSTCSRCGVTDGENKEHTPAEDDGDCSTEVKCSVCGDVTTPAGQHTPNADDGDCTTPITCSVCGTTTTPAKDNHTGGTATCTNKAVCTVCNTAYGTVDSNNHIDENTDHICDRECGKTNIGTHADSNTDHACDYGCSTTIGTHADTNSDHNCEYGCSTTIGVHSDSENDDDHTCDYGCGATLEDCKGGTATCTAKAECTVCGTAYGELAPDNHIDSNKDHICDRECGKTDIGTHADGNTDHACDYGCSTTIGTHADTNSDHNCEYGCSTTIGVHSDSENDDDHTCDYGCGATLEDCKGGTATCTAKAECTVCGTTYGELDPDNHIDSNKDHICDRECGKTDVGTHADTNNDHNCEYGCLTLIGTHSDSENDDDHTCDYGCGATLEDCKGGTATCVSGKVCEICGVEYDLTKNPENHASTEFTYTDNGDKTHDRVCSECGYVEVDNEKHTFDEESYECICGAKLPVVVLSSQTEGSTLFIAEDTVIIGDGIIYDVTLHIVEDTTVTFDVGAGGVQLLASITVADTKTLTLLVKGDAEHIVKKGISLGNGSNVIIEGDLDKPDNKLTVTATGSNAGIGANNGVTAGDITIRNARVDATGSSKEVSADSNKGIMADTSISGAAIGTSDGSMGNILIENSIIVAEGGYYESTSHAPAIGIGFVGSTMGNITLKDSQITARNNGDGLASVIGAGANHHVYVSGTMGDIIIKNTDLNLSMAIGIQNCYAAMIGSGIGFSHCYVNMGKIIFSDVTQAELDEMIANWLPSDFNEWGAYALGRGYDGSAYQYDAFGGVWVSDGNGGTVQIGNESGYYCLNEAIQ